MIAATCGWEFRTAFAILLAVGIGNTLIVGAKAQNNRPITLDDVRNLKEVGSMDLSPDGDMLAYTVSWQHPELWLADTRQGSVPNLIAKGQFPRWSPDGRRLAYYSRSSGTLQLWVMDSESRHLSQVTQLERGIDPSPSTRNRHGWLGDPLRYSWSPDGTRLIFCSQVVTGQTNTQDASSEPAPESGNRLGEGASKPLILGTETPTEWTLAGIFRSEAFGEPRHWVGHEKVQQNPSANSLAAVTSNQLFIVDIQSKVVKQLTHDDAQYYTPDWSPDGRTILCVSTDKRRPLGSRLGLTNLFTINIATGDKTALTTDAVYEKHVPFWSPDGKWIEYFGTNGENPEEMSLFVIPGTGGTPINVTNGLDRLISEAHWLPDSKSLAIGYYDGVNLPVAQLAVPGGSVEVLTGAEAAVRLPICVSRSGTVAWNQSDADGTAIIHVLPHGQQKSYMLIDLNPEIKEFELGMQEIVRWKNHSGDDREGVLVKPVGYQKGHRYPVILDVYPKLQNSFKAWPMMPGQFWAARGYAVFYPDGDAPNAWDSHWKSMRGRSKARGPKGVDIAVDDVVSGADELVLRGIADPHRMCLYGFSSGGAIVNQVVTKTSRFACAVSVAAALSADWTLPFFLEPSKSIPRIVGTSPWDNPESYIALSAVYRLNKVSTPMLLADGDDDEFFLLGQIEMYNGLRYLGKDVTFLRYPGQGHGFEGEALKDFWERENAFFDKYLRPRQPPN